MEVIGLPKIEAFLRIFAILMLVMSACLLGFDSQTKTIAYLQKRVTYKDLKSLFVLMNIACVAAVYNILQLSKYYILNRWYKGNLKGSNRYLAWFCFFFDQIAVYVTYAATTAAVGESLIAVTGVEIFQWMEWCNKFTRFCFQIGGVVFCCFLAFLLMASISFISAFNLFRLYSPKHFLHFKPSLINY
ncbi:CASP-like protein 2C1 [Euphorbia lathyris]|uniref:CASP-like protein 2C1 n=1 Tax=Euphorbia lathyris TaxID=212925 RepID=UPI0033138AFF